MSEIPITSIIAFLIGTIFIYIIGNGFLSSQQKKITILNLTQFENIAISLGLGYLFIIIYGYIVSIFVSITNVYVFGIQGLAIVWIPLCAGISLKLFFTKKQLEKGQSLPTFLVNRVKFAIKRICNFFQHRPKNDPIIRGSIKNVIAIVIFGILATWLLTETYMTFAVSDLYFESDPYTWAGLIINFRNLLSFTSPVVNYPEGFVTVGAFFLFFLPDGSFTSQYFFLKWFPFFNLGVILFLALVIGKRVFNRNKGILIGFLLILIWDRYFIYRTTLLVPTILGTLLLAVLLLMLAIPNFPVALIYLTVGGIFVLHPINGLIVVATYFSYVLLLGIWKFARLFFTRRSQCFKIVFNHIRQHFFSYIKNIAYFGIPFSVYAICASVCFHVIWYETYTYFLGIPISALASSPLVTQILNTLTNILQVGTPPITFSSWVYPYFFFACACVFVPPQLITARRDKNHYQFINFLKCSVLVSAVIFYFWLICPLVQDHIYFQVFGVRWIYIYVRFVNSAFFQWVSLRPFEVLAIPGAFLIVLTLVGIFRWCISKAWSIQKKLSKSNTLDFIYVLILIGFFTVNLMNTTPYYTYNFSEDNQYPAAITFFRDYLYTTHIPFKEIGYNEVDNHTLSLILGSFFKVDCNTWPENVTLPPENITEKYIGNSNNTLDFLIITYVNNPYWSSQISFFANSPQKIYQNDQVLILSCSIVINSQILVNRVHLFENYI